MAFTSSVNVFDTVVRVHERDFHISRVYPMMISASPVRLKNSRSVAAPGNGQWIYLFTPREGQLEAEQLVDLSKHNYELEPNVTFTPDGKWIVFRSNLHGPTHVYAVEVQKAK